MLTRTHTHKKPHSFVVAAENQSGITSMYKLVMHHLLYNLMSPSDLTVFGCIFNNVVVTCVCGVLCIALSLSVSYKFNRHVLLCNFYGSLLLE